MDMSEQAGFAILDSTERLTLARQLVAELEAGNDLEATDIIGELSNSEDNKAPLFQEVGRLTRELHEAINGFVLDTSVAEMVQVDMPDAAERLRYVIETTENAAHQTMDAIDKALPISDSLQSKANDLNQRWGKFVHRELGLNEFKELSGELGEFLQQSAKDSKALHDKLNEVMMAQGFQDITGQIIKKVIVLVQDVETKLISLVRLAGGSQTTSQNDEAKKKQRMAEEDGPAVPGVTQSQTVSDQDDVDDLLSSLGF